MISHDAAFETLAKAPVKTTDVIVSRQIPDPSVEYIQDTDAIWVSGTDGIINHQPILMQVNIDSVGAFLGTVTKKATVKLIGIIDNVENGDIFKIELGLYNNDPSVEGFDYICQGYYLVDNVAYDYDSGSTTVTMYDHMWTAKNTSYTDTAQSTGFTYPSTVEELASQMATAIGVNLMTGFSDLPNAGYLIVQDPYANISNATLQTVIEEIAQATGTTARISNTTLVFSIAGDLSG
jgi:hypothetical protein